MACLNLLILISTESLYFCPNFELELTLVTPFTMAGIEYDPSWFFLGSWRLGLFR